MKTLTCLLLLSILSASLCHPHQDRHYAIDIDFNIFSIFPHETESMLHDPSIAGTGRWADDINNSGWTYLFVNTSAGSPDWVQARATGYFEGYLAYEYIYADYNNEGWTTTSPPKNVSEWITNQTFWIEEQIMLYPEDNYWQLVNTTINQLEGMYEGYIAACYEHQHADWIMSFSLFYLLSYDNDYGDVYSLMFSDSDIEQNPHCSFMARLTEDDLYVSHTTWAPYQDMIKIYKVFNYSLSNPIVVNNFVTYSAQPGGLSSGDDYYVMNNNKFVSETTLQSQNPEVYQYLHTNSVPYWIRVTVANFAFSTPETWVNYYFSNRSGTYNNQWLIVDFDAYFQYQNNMSDATNVIWLAEEFYSLTNALDVTQAMLVPQGYVASYNVPYSPVLQNLSQDSTNYTSDPRYFLFKKYAPTVQTFEEFQFVMRLNNISDTGDYCQAIAARCDLASGSEASPFGAIDCKATSATMIQNIQTQITVGPTTEDLPPFNWLNWPADNSTRLGMPNVYNYSWYLLNTTTGTWALSETIQEIVNNEIINE